MSNTINLDQNERKNLELLAAQRQLYNEAKQIQAIQLGVIVIIPIVLSAIVAISQDFKVWASFYGLCASLVDALVLESLAKEKRKIAARVQELFDCKILSLDWNNFCVGDKPEPEVISEACRSYLQCEDGFDILEDWYPQGLESLPNGLARLICQRTNCWWDSELRRKYRATLYVSLAALGVISIGLTLAIGASFQDFVLIFLAPLSPVYLVGIRIAKKQEDIIQTSDKLRKHAEKVWNDTVSKQVSESALKVLSRELQNEIFAHRCNREQVPDWFYRFFRSSQQLNMEEGARRMIEEAKAAFCSV